jgi:hypothetical protein
MRTCRCAKTLVCGCADDGSLAAEYTTRGCVEAAAAVSKLDRVQRRDVIRALHAVVLPLLQPSADVYAVVGSEQLADTVASLRLQGLSPHVLALDSTTLALVPVDSSSANSSPRRSSSSTTDASVADLAAAAAAAAATVAAVDPAPAASSGGAASSSGVASSGGAASSRVDPARGHGDDEQPESWLSPLVIATIGAFLVAVAVAATVWRRRRAPQL